MDWARLEISERLPAHSAEPGCFPCLQRLSAPRVDLKHRISLAPRASRVDGVSHRSRPCAANTASILRTNHATARKTRRMCSAFPFAFGFDQMQQMRTSTLNLELRCIE